MEPTNSNSEAQFLKKIKQAIEKLESSNRITLRLYTLALLFISLTQGEITIVNKKKDSKKGLTFFPLYLIFLKEELYKDENALKKTSGKKRSGGPKTNPTEKKPRNNFKSPPLKVLMKQLKHLLVKFETKSTRKCKKIEDTVEFIKSFQITDEKLLKLVPENLIGTVDMEKFQNTYGVVLYKMLEESFKDTDKVVLCSRNAKSIPYDKHIIYVEDILFGQDTTNVSITISCQSGVSISNSVGSNEDSKKTETLFDSQNDSPNPVSLESGPETVGQINYNPPFNESTTPSLVSGSYFESFSNPQSMEICSDNLVGIEEESKQCRCNNDEDRSYENEFCLKPFHYNFGFDSKRMDENERGSDEAQCEEKENSNEMSEEVSQQSSDEDLMEIEDFCQGFANDGTNYNTEDTDSGDSFINGGFSGKHK
ncbi:hypothetical protein QTN25_008789 [Entamoeba marina]